MLCDNVNMSVLTGAVAWKFQYLYYLHQVVMNFIKKVMKFIKVVMNFIKLIMNIIKT